VLVIFIFFLFPPGGPHTGCFVTGPSSPPPIFSLQPQGHGSSPGCSWVLGGGGGALWGMGSCIFNVLFLWGPKHSRIYEQICKATPFPKVHSLLFVDGIFSDPPPPGGAVGPVSCTGVVGHKTEPRGGLSPFNLFFLSRSPSRKKFFPCQVFP